MSVFSMAPRDLTRSDNLFPGWHDASDPNPAVHHAGKGPDGKRCKTCAHLLVKDAYSKRYYKCEYRGNTNSVATDHRVGWNACARYEEG